MFKKIKEESRPQNLAVTIVEQSKNEKIGINEVMVHALRDIYVMIHFTKDEKAKAYVEKLAMDDIFEAREFALKDKVFAKDMILFDSKKKKDYFKDLDFYINAFKSNRIREWEYENSVSVLLKELIEKTPTVESMEDFMSKMPDVLDSISPENRKLVEEMSKVK